MLLIFVEKKRNGEFLVMIFVLSETRVVMEINWLYSCC